MTVLSLYSLKASTHLKHLVKGSEIVHTLDQYKKAIYKKSKSQDPLPIIQFTFNNDKRTLENTIALRQIDRNSYFYMLKVVRIVKRESAMEFSSYFRLRNLCDDKSDCDSYTKRYAHISHSQLPKLALTFTPYLPIQEELMRKLKTVPSKFSK